MAMFNSELLNYQRVTMIQPWNIGMQSSQPWMAWSWWCRTKICGFPLAPSPLLMAEVGGLIVHALTSLFVFTLDSTFPGLSVWFCRKEALFGAEGIRQRWEPRKMHDTSPLVPFNWFDFFHMWNPLHNTFIMVFSMFLNPPNKTSHGRFHTEISHTLCVYIYIHHKWRFPKWGYP